MSLQYISIIMVDAGTKNVVQKTLHDTQIVPV